ncbi:MAG: hypothetical protein ACFFD2_22225 [Promethearchaeota archaeon]
MDILSIGIIKKIKDNCNAGYKRIDQVEYNGYNSGGLCEFFILILPLHHNASIWRGISKKVVRGLVIIDLIYK